MEPEDSMRRSPEVQAAKASRPLRAIIERLSQTVKPSKIDHILNYSG